MTVEPVTPCPLGENFRRKAQAWGIAEKAEREARAQHEKLVPKVLELIQRYPVLSPRGAFEMAAKGQT